MESKSLVPTNIQAPAKKKRRVPAKRRKKSSQTTLAVIETRETLDGEQQSKDKNAILEATGIFLVFFSAVITLTLVNGLRGVLPAATSDMLARLFKFFGLGLFVVPMFTLFCGIHLFLRSRIAFSRKNLFGFTILYFSLLGILSSEGGKWGGAIHGWMAQWFGPASTKILFLGAITASLVLIFNEVYKDVLKIIYLITRKIFIHTGQALVTVSGLTARAARQLFELINSYNNQIIENEQRLTQHELPVIEKSNEEISSNSGLLMKIDSQSQPDFQEPRMDTTINSPATTHLEVVASKMLSQEGDDQPETSNHEDLDEIEKSTESPITVAEETIPDKNMAENSIKDSGNRNFSEERLPTRYHLPGLELLSRLNPADLERIRQTNETYILEKKEILLGCFKDFGVKVEIGAVTVGSSIIRFEIKPDKGTPVNNIARLKNDISLYLATESVRIEAPIPGKDAVGVEIPLRESFPVRFSDLIRDKKFLRHPGPLYFALGKNITGENIFADLAAMPHLLVAGQTGSGKSVGMNCIINSILYRATPEQVRFIMIDPKVVELSIYNDLPHLLAPVVTDSTEAPAVLMWAVEEMERRYLELEKYQTRHINGYNKRIKKEIERDPECDLEEMPFIVIFIDELNDLMMVARKEIEGNITRIAQKARAVGIHLVVATQRPSKDVITGTLKGNLPSRIAFQVASYHDSKTILDKAGAEVLLGKGDMLFTPVGKPKPVRIQGAFISDDECKTIIEHFQNQNYPQDFVDLRPNEMVNSGEENTDIQDIDPKINEILEYMYQEGEVSVSAIQRRFSMGYNRSGRIIDALESLGLLEPQTSGVKKRKVTTRIREYVSNTGEYVS